MSVLSSYTVCTGTLTARQLTLRTERQRTTAPVLDLRAVNPTSPTPPPHNSAEQVRAGERGGGYYVGLAQIR